MKSSHSLVTACCIGLFLGLSTAAAAISNANLPAEHTNGLVTYTSGGVGSDQAVAMKRDASRFPLGLEFVQGKKDQHAMYLADVQVTIKNAAGRVLLDKRSDGPYLLASLPDGHYTISAEHAGKREMRQVQVEHGKHQMFVFDWVS
jgi:hypothetical protein